MNVPATGERTAVAERDEVVEDDLIDKQVVDKPAMRRSEMIAAAIAVVSLLLVVALAFSGETKPTLADRVTLLALSVMAIICFCTPLARHFEANACAGTFALTTAMFVIYGLARRAGPSEGWPP